jgi:hypothetical protein
MGDVKSASSPTGLSSADTTQLVPVGQRTRLRSVLLSGPTCQITFLNGSANGSGSVFSIISDSNGAGGPFQLSIPGNGVLFDNGIGVLVTSADNTFKSGSVTIFYEG